MCIFEIPVWSRKLNCRSIKLNWIWCKFDSICDSILSTYDGIMELIRVSLQTKCLLWMQFFEVFCATTFYLSFGTTIVPNSGSRHFCSPLSFFFVEKESAKHINKVWKVNKTPGVFSATQWHAENVNLRVKGGGWHYNGTQEKMMKSPIIGCMHH